MNSFSTSQSNNCCDSYCRANQLCAFNGNLDDVVSTPIYVQSVYDAVRFNLQGMRTVQNLRFTPALPCGCTVNKIVDIRIKKFFDPSNASCADNLTLEMETGVSGACFVNDSHGIVETIGPDGVPSERLLFSDTNNDDCSEGGTPIFGTQNAKIWGNIIIYLDLSVCDNCGRESFITLCAELNVARSNCPLVLTNFFELCMPNTANSAFLPRLTELANVGFSGRLATNNVCRDLCIDNNGEITANMIITICVTAEKKITVPVQLCVLSTGFAEAPAQENLTGVMNCPGLFPERNDGTSETFNNMESSNDNCCSCNDYPPTVRY